MYITEQYLNEKDENGILYHGSRIQGLKILNTNYNISNIDMNDKRKWIYAATNKTVASAFTFFWYNDMGIKFGRVNNGPWTFEIPKKLLPLIQNPCSIYIVSSDGFIKAEGGLMEEYRTNKSVKVLEEEKYKSSKECMLKNDVRIKVIN